MPDWSYQPVLRPLLFCLPPSAGRRTALSAMGVMQSTAPTRAVFAAMCPRRVDDPRTVMGVEFPTRVGLGPGIDQRGRALALWPLLGFGFLHLGYFGGPAARRTQSPTRRRRAYEVSWTEDDDAITLDALAARIETARRVGLTRVPILGWLRADATADDVTRLGEIVDVVSLPVERRDLAMHANKPVLSRVRLDRADALAIRDARDGILLVPPDGRDSPDLTATVLTAMNELRDISRERCVVVGAGVFTPSDASRLFDAGADLLEVNTGLVYAGPGIAHRIEKAATR